MFSGGTRGQTQVFLIEIEKVLSVDRVCFSGVCVLHFDVCDTSLRVICVAGTSSTRRDVFVDLSRTGEDVLMHFKCSITRGAT